MTIIPAGLTKREYVTLRLHIIYNLCEGVMEGVFLLASFVFIKSLLGGNYQTSLLFQSMIGIYTFAVIATELMKRARNMKRMLMVAGTLTRLPLFAFAFFGASAAGNNAYLILFLAIFGIYYSSRTVIYPAINQILKQSYSESRFGRLYSIATAARTATAVLSTFAFGIVSDAHPMAYRAVFPLCGALGLVSVYMLLRIPFRQADAVHYIGSVGSSIAQSFRSIVQGVRGNTAYLQFEVAYMLYGFGYMLTYPVITIFFKTGLSLNYTSVSFYQYWYYILSVILLPVFGKVISRMEIRSFSIIPFTAMMLYICGFLLVSVWPAQFSIGTLQIHIALLAGYTMYGIYAGSHTLLYNIGSAYFCGREQAASYQAMHLSLSGARALVFPLIGVWVYERYGFAPCFAAAAFGLFLSVVVLQISRFRTPLNVIH